MSKLKVRGIHSANTCNEFSTDEAGSIDDTYLFPKWWDKKANCVEYIRVFKLRMHRVCDDIDVIIPASADVEIRGDYDGNVTFRFDYHRGVKRMALTEVNSTKVTAEYIFPTNPSQQPRYKEYGAGPVVCFASDSLGSWQAFVVENRPNLDLGSLSIADGFYDLNQEPFNGFDMGDLPELPSQITDLGTLTFFMNISPGVDSGLTLNQNYYATVNISNESNNSVDSDIFLYEWTLPPFLEFIEIASDSGGTVKLKATRPGAGTIRCNVTIKDPDSFSMDNWEPHTVSKQVYAA